MHVLVADLPSSLQRALRSVGYARKDIRAEVGPTFTAPAAYGSGHRAQAMVVELATGRMEGVVGSWGGANPFEQHAIDVGGESTLPSGFAALTSSMTGYWTLHLNPANAAKWLGSGTSEVSPREAWILGSFAGLTSAGRKDEFSRHGRGQEPSPEEIGTLAARGYLKVNKAGAVQITTAGKNQAGLAGRRPDFVPR